MRWEPKFIITRISIYMRKNFFKSFVSVLFIVASFLTACNGHVHDYSKEVCEDSYLKTEATCISPAEYYKSCSCGAKGEETFSSGSVKAHEYDDVVSEEYLRTPSNCRYGAVYYKSCVVCGKKSDVGTFTYGTGGACSYTQKIIDDVYLKAEATPETPAEYFYSCICGNIGEESFFYGDALGFLSDEEKIPYTPTSLTVTLYDAENSVYGFTYNTTSEPLRPVLQIQEGNELTDDLEEYSVSVTQSTTNGGGTTYYICKVAVELEADTTYTYRAYDKYAMIGTEKVTLQTKDTKSTSFKFAHVSDSQTYGKDNAEYASEGTGAYFAKTLSKIVGNNDFIVHSGDIVERSSHEAFWTEMIDKNFAYWSKIPMMAVSGNHDTTYKAGSNELFKHFHYKIPEQSSTLNGYYYSFVYGNCKFLMLNTNNSVSNQGLETAQYNWIVSELQNNTADWTVVVMHHPVYSAGVYGSESGRNGYALLLQTQLQGIFAEYGVDLVLQGHDHVISRTYPINANGVQTETIEVIGGTNYSINPNGVIYLENGPGGNQSRNPYSGINKSLYSYAEGSNACSWAEFEINGNQMTVSVKYTDGTNTSVYQQWGIKKTD